MRIRTDSSLTDKTKGENWRNLFTIYILFVALLINHYPYTGIWHDSGNYMLQALSILTPEAFKNDLFFLHGSQANYTLFPYIQALAIKVFGIDNAALLLTVIGQTIQLTGFVFLATYFLKPRESLFALTLLCFLPFWNIVLLQPIEMFATSRPFAQAAVLFAIGSYFRGNRASGIVMSIIAVTLHPLMAITPLFIASCVISKRLTALASTLAVIILIITSILHIPPANHLLTTVDEEWFKLILMRTDFLLLADWELIDWLHVSARLSIIYFAYIISSNILRSVSGATLFATLLFITISFIGGDILHNQLMLELQLWRVIWFMNVISAICLVVIVKRSLNDRKMLLALCLYPIAYILTNLVIGGITPILLSILPPFIYQIKRIHISSRMLKIVSVILLILALSYALDSATYTYITSKPIKGNIDAGITPILSVIFDFLTSGIFFVLLFYILLVTDRFKINTILSVVTLCILCTTLLLFNKQPFRYDSIDQNLSNKIETIIPANSTVLWLGSTQRTMARTTWFTLKRSHYISTQQTVGMVFNRELAIEARRRESLLNDAGIKTNAIGFLQPKRKVTFSKSTGSDFNVACKDSQLDYIIVQATQIENKLPIFQLRNKRWLIIDCNSEQHYLSSRQRYIYSF